MRPRQTIIEIFSTFLQFESDRFSGWITDPKLRRSMQNRLNSQPQPETSENFWAIYWYKVWQSQPDSAARAHLMAYLQEPCYWVASKTAASFASSQYNTSDCFQLAIAQIDKVLKGFIPDRGSVLKNYASVIFSSLMREILRQQRVVDVCTPWALLRRISHKMLLESLKAAGLSANAIAAYILAWNCFKTVYVPTAPTGTRKLDSPDLTAWKAIASLYNTERYSQLNPPGNEIQPEIVEKWLLGCEKAVRKYLYPAQTSINAPMPGQETGEMVDNLADPEQVSLLSKSIELEEEQKRQSQQLQIQGVLMAAIAKMEPTAQEMLQMYYAQGRSQQEIAVELQIKQYTVSRRLTKAKESLLLTLAQWSKDTLHISLNSQVIKDSTTLLEEWLKTHYSPSRN
ncbi:MAG: sigma-70 family RNA polymerase sigma factor [Cyanosarcina radialis HA8281-LM2]|jgi:RNA polymerase sigma factor (sigma-70 family)|nr:sigma-70 family RNA polymerase sigma factor [Cyanosarcina radialis HA8281-LM2]